ncbi:methylated-DNA--[protein]-cysteine S-methyltransferase [Helicobacter pametensis]|uniref:methylated-DNA--[protein]-cysteine S-methyltransferase n=1 Tax=Helicobacter pametensis TaxID=95149 RepID=UPI000487472F|nr:methylated-DNA--[protein]-cysteine S-methyltransferase [Helicobacter pametensis]
MNQIFERIRTPMGDLYCVIEREKIVLLHFDSQQISHNAQKSPHPLIQECQSQLDAYFKSSLKTFSLSLEIKGSDFKKRALQALQNLAYGEMITYQTLAQMAGSPKAYRAIGSLLAQNPILILIPCHRVILSNGQLGGYTWGKEKKKKLLKLEGHQK